MNPQDQELQALPTKFLEASWEDLHGVLRGSGYLTNNQACALAYEIQRKFATQEPQRAEPGANWAKTFDLIINNLTEGDGQIDQVTQQLIEDVQAHLATRKDVSPPPEPAELPGMWERADIEGGETDCAPAAPPSAPEDVGAMEYRGNTVSYMYDRAKAYGDEIMRCWHVLKDAGRHPGRTDDVLHEVLRKALATSAPAEPLSDAELSDLMMRFSITSSARGIRAFDQVRSFARAVLAKQGGAV